MGMSDWTVRLEAQRMERIPEPAIDELQKSELNRGEDAAPQNQYELVVNHNDMHCENVSAKGALNLSVNEPARFSELWRLSPNEKIKSHP
jgi:hypothetical protein